MDFDVFLSHNSADKLAARSLATLLKRRGLSVWFDEWELQPGDLLVTALAGALESVGSAVVLISPAGEGPWQGQEVQALIVELINKAFPVIPVLINGATPTHIRLFLKPLLHLNCNQGFGSAELEGLVKKIKGTRASTSEGAGEAEARRQQVHDAKAGLDEFRILLQNAEIRSFVDQFRADFAQTHEQLNTLDYLKRSHDLFHTLQFQCESILAHGMNGRGEIDWTLVEDAEATLADQVEAFRARIETVPPPADVDLRWLEKLDRIQKDLTQAYEAEDKLILGRALNLLRARISAQLPDINTRLNEKARSLRMGTLVAALTKVWRQTRGDDGSVDVEDQTLETFRRGVVALRELHQQLRALIELHDTWQMIDRELRPMASTVDGDFSAIFEDSWPEMRAYTASLADTLPERLLKATQDLDEAIASGETASVRKAFRRFQRGAGREFYQVDREIKDLCSEFRGISDRISIVLEMLKP